MDFTWKIGGEAGFGIMTSGLAFSKIASRQGFYIFDYGEYPSLIRGGHNAYEVIISNEEVFSHKSTIDCLVCLNQDAFKFHFHRLTADSFIIFDSQEFNPQGSFIKIDVPFKKILSDLKGEIIMKNTIALGASLAILGGDFKELMEIIRQQLAKKGEEIIKFNQRFAELGFDYVKKNYSSFIKPLFLKKDAEKKLVLSGNDAFSLGCVLADCRVYCAYPMTPSSSVLTTLASWQEKTGMIVRHAEDEISVINTAIGASFAGVRSAVGTSGGGFALMVESISFAGIVEIPLVIFLAQRPGPATGMPTWTEQGDLLFAVHAGHGEFPKIVLAPGDAYEMIELTVKAFNLADIYQTPVIIVSDMFLSECHKNIPQKSIDEMVKNYKIVRGKTVDKPSATPYLRYQITEDGVSERLIPGTKDFFYQANSYEHLENSHTTEESEARKKQVEKRNKKIVTYLNTHFQMPRIYGDYESSEIVFVSWGSHKSPVVEAMKLLKAKGVKTSLIHFNHVYPLDGEKIRPLFSKNKRYILVENNSQAQWGKLLRQETGVEISEKILKYDGRPIWAEEIVKKL